jgi:hypothetical protein
MWLTFYHEGTVPVLFSGVRLHYTQFERLSSFAKAWIPTHGNALLCTFLQISSHFGHLERPRTKRLVAKLSTHGSQEAALHGQPAGYMSYEQPQVQLAKRASIKTHFGQVSDSSAAKPSGPRLQKSLNVTSLGD